jgi:hypothetical protein
MQACGDASMTRGVVWSNKVITIGTKIDRQSTEALR